MRGRRPPLLIKHVQFLLLISATHLVTISLGFLPKRHVQSPLPMSALCSNFLPKRHAILSPDESIPCTFLLPFPSQETCAIPAPNEFISVAISFPVERHMNHEEHQEEKSGEPREEKRRVSGFSCGDACVWKDCAVTGQDNLCGSLESLLSLVAPFCLQMPVQYQSQVALPPSPSSSSSSLSPSIGHICKSFSIACPTLDSLFYTSPPQVLQPLFLFFLSRLHLFSLFLCLSVCLSLLALCASAMMDLQLQQRASLLLQSSSSTVLATAALPSSLHLPSSHLSGNSFPTATTKPPLLGLARSSSTTPVNPASSTSPAVRRHGACSKQLASRRKLRGIRATKSGSADAPDSSASTSSSERGSQTQQSHLELLERFTTQNSATASAGKEVKTIREQLSSQIEPEAQEVIIPLSSLEKLEAPVKELTISQKRNIRRQDYLTKVSERNDVPFFATLAAVFLVPPICILGIAVATGYIDLFP